jgi:hypothetical protein
MVQRSVIAAAVDVVGRAGEGRVIPGQVNQLTDQLSSVYGTDPMGYATSSYFLLDAMLYLCPDQANRVLWGIG